MSTKVIGNILWLRCSVCALEFPTFGFSGENDAFTSGFRTKTDLKKKTLYIYDISNDSPSGSIVEFIRSEFVPSIMGESFQEYRSRVKNCRDLYFYRCVRCGSEGAEMTACLSTEELESKDYTFVDCTRGA